MDPLSRLNLSCRGDLRPPPREPDPLCGSLSRPWLVTQGKRYIMIRLGTPIMSAIG